jgi:hypothetical protein
MIDHNLQQFGLNGYNQGVQIQPSEHGNLFLQSTMQQFIVQAHRAYTFESLNSITDCHGNNELSIIPLDNEDILHKVPYFYMKLIIQSNEFEDFFDDIEDFSDALHNIVSYSKISQMRGKRGAWVSEYDVDQNHKYGKVITYDILISTSIFYNDYRVTTNFPNSNLSMDMITDDIYKDILRQYPDLKVEIESIVI